jgi:rod shape determining protein RodA
MSYLELNTKHVPSGPRKIIHLNWALALLLIAVSSIGFLMLYSVAAGDISKWAEPQMKRFVLGFVMMFVVALVPIWFWRSVSGVAFIASLLLLVSVEFFGVEVNGAKRWIDVGFRLQPSEIAKITLVMALASYYDWLPASRKSRPLWVLIPIIIILIPTAIVQQQPDLGTSLLLLALGGAIMFMAGVHWLYFAVVTSAGIGLVTAVIQSRDTTWQLLKNYQYKRIDIFLDPAADPIGAGYNITQAKIALGSGGWTGRGFMQGTQSRLNFLPEKHTDFIFTILAEEFGFLGAFSLLILYVLIILFCVVSALANKDRFASILTLGVALNFFLYFALNMSMVMGMAPVVGVPLPLVSYGGSSMLALMLAFGLVQSAHIHRPR